MDTTGQADMSGETNPTQPGFEPNNHNADKMEGFCDLELQEICEL